jgi:predicted RNA-binding Zn-ribbon protein involved in translation (DUF1610 family)
MKLREIMEILMKSKYSTPRPVFCPKCQSPKIKLKESYGILPQKYNCEECNYEGTFIFELDPIEEKP